jgi:hypothetical protein
MELEKYFRWINKKMVDRFIQEKQEEHLTLEFKTVKNAELLDKNDKKNFAEALSGFSNSSGGVIVWGIETKKIKGTDYANGVKEIQPLSLFMSRLNQLTGELVKPIVDGVEHRRIRISGDRGIAKTLIPPSDAGPHMAMGGLGKYYKRSGDSFYPMEHFDIEDMFGRRRKPTLSLSIGIERADITSGPKGRKFTCEIFVGVKNTGRGIAKNVALAVEANHPYCFSDHAGFNRKRIPGSNKILYPLGSDNVIHQNSSIAVSLISFRFWETQDTIPDVLIDAELMAEDMRAVEEKRVITEEEIRSKVIPKNT